jgi:hypothetical protein
MKLLACLLLVCGVLSSCSTAHCDVTVTRHHQLPPKGAGQTFEIIDNSKESSSSLQRAALAGRISAHLQRYGWKLAAAGTKPNYGVVLGYATVGAHRDLFSSPVYNYVGGGTVHHSGTVSSYSGGSASYEGTSYQPGSLELVGYRNYTQMQYDRYLVLNIFDSPSHQVFASKSDSTGSTADATIVAPYMVDAVFKKFPGRSGETKTISIHH